MDGMDVMDGVDPEGEALHLMRAVRFVSSLLSPFSSLASGPARSGPLHTLVARFARREVPWTEWT
jgi:hypothetical protein